MGRGAVVALVGLREIVVAELEDYLVRAGFSLHDTPLHCGVPPESLPDDADIVVIGDTLKPMEAASLVRKHGNGRALLLVVSRPTELVERVLLLEAGAADVVEQPIHSRELAARIAGLAARKGVGGRDLLVLERSTVDLKAARVMTRSGAEEQLSLGQIALLRLFMANPRRVLTREDIIASAPAEDEDAFDRAIDSRIVRLRRKLDTDSIVTIRGAGYRFDPPA